MRVLFVNERLGRFGGVEQNVADTALALRARGHQCRLAYTMATGRGEDEYARCFDECLQLPSDAVSADAPAGPELAEAVASFAPDVIYLHKLPRVAAFAPYLGRTRVVRMVHDHDLCCPRGYKYFAISGRVCSHKADWRCWLDGAFLARDRSSRTGVRFVGIGHKLREMRANRGLDALLVGSRFMRDELLQNGFRPERVHILPPTVPSRPGPPPTAVPDAPHVLFVGQLLRGKGVDLLLDALAQLQRPFSATIVGAGNAEAKLKERCRSLGLNDRVRFIGWIDNSGLAPFYAEAKVVVVPSRWPEPFGMVGLEAMRHGRPVVGFDVGGIPDWLRDGETGYAVPEQDTAAFAQAVDRLLGDTALANRFGRNARQYAQDQFSYEDYLNRIEAILSGRKNGKGGA